MAWCGLFVANKTFHASASWWAGCSGGVITGGAVREVPQRFGRLLKCCACGTKNAFRDLLLRSLSMLYDGLLKVHKRWLRFAVFSQCNVVEWFDVVLEWFV